jgi:ribonucleases P/MRP protein subunit RPP40
MPVLRPSTSPDITPYDSDFEDFAVDIHEWLSLISLQSPRIDPSDQIDSFLSRYAPPANVEAKASLVKVTWRGLMTSAWAYKTFVKALVAISRDAWFAYSVESYSEAWPEESKECMVLKVPDVSGEYVLWEPA